MNILIIEDDVFLAIRLKKVFEKKVITNRIKILNSYIDFIHEIPVISSYDIILTDILLGKAGEKSGINIIEIIRKRNLEVPIVVISSYDDIMRIERSFNIGANDYIIKPFRLKELEVRVLKWFKSFCLSANFNNHCLLKYKKLIYNFDTNEFYFKDKKVLLTKKAKFILFILFLNKEKLISKRELREKLWGDHCVVKKRNLRVSILRLKKLLKEPGIDNRIINKRGEGYILQKK